MIDASSLATCMPASGFFGYRLFEYVYTIQIGTCLKVGRSHDPAKRLAVFVKGKGNWSRTNTRCPSHKIIPPSQYASARLVAAWKVDGRVAAFAERYLHARLRKARVSSTAQEWFKCSPADVEPLKSDFEAAWRAALAKFDPIAIPFTR